MNRPWYREFWLWFVLAPLIAVVIASLVTLILAGGPPELVVDEAVRSDMPVERSAPRP